MADRDRPAHAGDATEGFLSRWSRRKAEARSAPSTPAAAPSVADETPRPPETAPAPQEEHAQDAQPCAPTDLPDIESLDAGSDFTPFMRPGVPAHLRTLALRKLWRSDPIFSKLDGLVEYGEDYTIPSWPKGALKTAYRIGRGFVNEPETPEAAEPGSAPPEPPVSGPAPESEPELASPSQKPSPESPAEPPHPAPLPAASNEASPLRPPEITRSEDGTQEQQRRRPLPRRG